jgi:phosphatidylglycerophosphatase A
VSIDPNFPSPGAPNARAVAAENASRKPRFALLFATVCGLGYMPVAPGTFGSLVGVVLYALVGLSFPLATARSAGAPTLTARIEWMVWTGLPLAVLVAGIGVWAARRTAIFSERKDPQFVVIDEVSGQFLAYFLAMSTLGWKYLLLGLILFRVFDIWKPFPARQAESLPGGWGIMADDWVAGIYAAIGLWAARAFLHL